MVSNPVSVFSRGPFFGQATTRDQPLELHFRLDKIWWEEICFCEIQLDAKAPNTTVKHD